MSKPPFLHSSCFFLQQTPSIPSRFLSSWNRRCEKREARSLLREPAGHCGNRSNTPEVGIGLTAKFVALLCRFPLQYFTSPTGSLARSRGEEVRTPTRERERGGRRGKRRRGQPNDFSEVPIRPHAALCKKSHRGSSTVSCSLPSHHRTSSWLLFIYPTWYTQS